VGAVGARNAHSMKLELDLTKDSAMASDTEEEDQDVWRYMSFARFVWMLQNKTLYLARADLLGDPWEVSLCNEQLRYVLSRHPISPIDGGPSEEGMERSARLIKSWRARTFVSCWSAARHESHALWRIYCSSVEGVAIRTTLQKLKASVAPTRVLKVHYQTLGTAARTPNITELVTRKRPMFAYEQEVRVVHIKRVESDSAVGILLDWNPEDVVEGIFVHPESEPSFEKTVIATVQTYAPKLADRVERSAMSGRPAF
jgi:hypothetical protein